MCSVTFASDVLQQKPQNPFVKYHFGISGSARDLLQPQHRRKKGIKTFARDISKFAWPSAKGVVRALMTNE